MAQTEPKMIFRIPADMKAWLKDRATTNRRTMNGEILTILAKAMKAEQARPPQPKSVTGKAA